MARKTTRSRQLADSAPAQPWASPEVQRETGNADLIGPDETQYPKPGDYITQRIAPWPAIDRFPLRIGSNRTLSYLSSVIRLCTQGYRMQFVDFLDEALEQDPHAYGSISKRVLGVARGKWMFSPANVSDGSPETPKQKRTRQLSEGKSSDEQLAERICRDVEARWSRIPNLKAELVKLAWGVYYGISASEILWTRSNGDWRCNGLSAIHSRRLAMPEWSRWRLFVWDQGPISPWESFKFPTQAPLGLCLDELPGKFVVYCPPVRGDYPTREGLGLEVIYWLMLKHVAARAAPIYLERFSKPIPEAVYSTARDRATGEIKAADRRDIEAIKNAMLSIAAGTQQSITHPDTIGLNFNLPQGGKGGPIRYNEWIDLVDTQVSVAVNGATLTTKQGSESSGSRANGDTQRKDQINTWGSDADCLAEAVRRSLIYWDVKLNYPTIDVERFLPQVDLSLEEDPDPTVIAERASVLANAGYPVDARKLEELVGIPLADHEDDEAIVMVPIKPQELIPPLRPSDPDEQADLVSKQKQLAANPPPPMQKIDPNTGKTIQAPTPIHALPKPGAGGAAPKPKG